LLNIAGDGVDCLLLGRGADLVHDGLLGLVAVLLVLLRALLLGRVRAGDPLAGLADGAQRLPIGGVADLPDDGLALLGVGVLLGALGPTPRLQLTLLDGICNKCTS
jgi:hypothetical protein